MANLEDYAIFRSSETSYIFGALCALGMDWVALPLALPAELVQHLCLITYHGAAYASVICVNTRVTHCLTNTRILVGASIHAEECIQDDQHCKNHDVM